MNEIKPITYWLNEYINRLDQAESYIEFQGYENIIRKIDSLMKTGIQYCSLKTVIN